MPDINDLVKIARKEIGTEEDPKHQNKGSSILKYQQSTTLGGQGWPWCAAFVDWCVQKFADEDGTKITHVPRTPAAFGLITWGNDNHYQVFNPGSVTRTSSPSPATSSFTSSLTPESYLAKATTITTSTPSKATQIRAEARTVTKFPSAGATTVP